MLRTADLLASRETLSRRFAGRVSPGGGRQLPRWLGPSSGGSFPHWLITASLGRSGVTASPPFNCQSLPSLWTHTHSCRSGVRQSTLAAQEGAGRSGRQFSEVRAVWIVTRVRKEPSWDR